jgi:hypothetical protein
MFYTYDTKEMRFKKKKNLIFLACGVSALIATAISVISCVSFYNAREVTKRFSEEERVMVLKQYQEDFSEDQFMRELLRLNIKYPHIVMAQAMQESSFKSPMFKHNHNMLGMKVATRRPSTNIGEQFGHANYDNWRDAVVDYALWQSTFIMDVKNEDEYYQILGKIYATGSDYVAVVKPQAEKWKPKFEELKEKIKAEKGE